MFACTCLLLEELKQGRAQSFLHEDGAAPPKDALSPKAAAAARAHVHRGDSAQRAMLKVML